MGKPEGYFFLVWAGATFITSVLLSFLTFWTHFTALGAGWILVPILGLTGSFLLIRKFRSKVQLFGEARKSIAAVWSILGPTIGFIGFESPSPLVAKLIVLGTGIAISGILTRERLTLYTGILCTLSSLIFARIPLFWQTLSFGIFTLIFMGLPGIIAILRTKNSKQNATMA
jgi:membrane protein